MPSIATNIVIDAPIEKVWSILMNHDDYPQWNPFVKQIVGDPKVGNQIEATIQPPGQKVSIFIPIVLVNQPPHEFRWRGELGAKWIFAGEHIFELEAVDEGKTKFKHGERFTGLLAGPLLAMIGKSTIAGFEAMNTALKERAETLS